MKACIECGKKIKEQLKNRAKYCSPKCRAKSANERRKEYIANWQREKNLKEAKEQGEEKIQCLVCGLWFKRIGRHVYNSHKTTAREYRRLNGLDVKRGIMTERSRAVMGEHTKRNGTIKNLKKGKKNQFKKGQKGVGVYERSEQTKERLRKQGLMLAKISRRNKK